MKRTLKWTLAVLILATAGCGAASKAAQTASEAEEPAPTPTTAVATFAGGCFWCMEPPFDKLAGVTATISGYTGGHLVNPTYKQVGMGGSGHYEAVQITYDPKLVSYEKLLEVFWRNIDPLDAGGQFCDRGESYRTAIFFHDARQEALARASLANLEGRFDAPIVTPLVEASTFYPAEDYHQNYYQENPIRYKFYRRSCGRDGRLEQLWGDEAGG
jgi:peptide-methionine (S)-S-oxide reductase